MKRTIPALIFLLSLQLFLSPSTSLNNFKGTENAFSFAEIQTSYVPHPVYVRLQAQQSGSVILWEAVPQNFSHHVGTMDVRDLAIFVSSNAKTINLSRDSVGNIWLAINYTFAKGDYISSLIRVSAKILSESRNLTIPTFVSFPQSYPPDVVPFLNSGRKIPVENETIERIANNCKSKTQNMIETVQNVLNFVNETQGYDRETVELLMSGTLNTTNILDFFKDPLRVMETNSSICIERSLYAATILRAAGVPTRTLTDVRLRTWIQVWLPGCGWVDAEAECAQQREEARVRFPCPLSGYAPWVIENSSDAAFPFTWLPETSMRVANLTFGNAKAFNINDYRTVFCQPIDKALFDANTDTLSFSVLPLEPEELCAATTWDGSNLAISLIKGEEKVSKMLTLNQTNSVSLGDIAISFKPVRQDNFVVLYNFVVQEAWRLDFRIFIIPAIGVPVVLIVWLYWKGKRIKRPQQKSGSTDL